MSPCPYMSELSRDGTKSLSMNPYQWSLSDLSRDGTKSL
jgi:hypothetical protein